ncbi:MAG: serine/threonine protein kinase [Myxococcota bacterium]|jgi:serine/threonine protein kinase
MAEDVLGHYRLLERLGEGAYGIVWRGAHEADPLLQVAIKEVRPQLASDAEFCDALRSECRQLDRLDHPNVVRFRDLIVGQSRLAMVLELLVGHDLNSALDAGPLPIPEVLRVLEAMLAGLAHAHDAGLVHRDVKPSNVFLCADGRVKLVDFGIARAADSAHATRSGQLTGTLEYVAPERFTGPGGPAADVYAAGLVAWEMLAGVRACPGGELARMMGWHLAVGAPDVRTVRPDTPDWLAAWVAGACAKDPAARPVDGRAALTALTVAREPVVAVPSGPRRDPSTVRVDRASLGTGPPPSDSTTSRPHTVSLSSGAAVAAAASTSIPETPTETPSIPVQDLPDVPSPGPAPHTAPRGGSLAIAALGALGLGGLAVAALLGFLGWWLYATPTELPQVVSVDLARVEHAHTVGLHDVLWADPMRERDLDQAMLRAGAEGERDALTELVARGVYRPAVLEIGVAGVSVGGVQLLPIVDGSIPEEAKRGQLISTLYDDLLERAESTKFLAELGGPAFTGRLVIAVDRRVPFRTVREVMFTAGQAQFGEFLFLVDDPGATPLDWRATVSPAARRITLTEDGGQRLLTAAGSEAMPVARDAVVSGAGRLLPGDAIGCALYLPQSHTPWERMAAAMDTLTSLGVPTVVIAGGVPFDGDEEVVDPPLLVAPRELRVSDQVAVLRSTLPAIGPPSTEAPRRECTERGLLPPLMRVEPM